ncbi:phage tail tape measure protein [Rhodobacteraceae bacterium XHP0102]|nr:phage tail tape measure protein [Rhodobacteraceae bacterium XHP0102]
MSQSQILARQLDQVEDAMNATSTMARQFQSELRNMQAALSTTNRDAQGLSRALQSGVSRAMREIVVDGASLSEAFRGLADRMINSAYRNAMRPIETQIGGAVGRGLSGLLGAIAPFQMGATMQPFARGGVVNRATPFAMAGGGLGVMGEAGPEAIMPLTRGSDGRLGVQSQGMARPAQITINIATPDVHSFQRSRSQIATQMARALEMGQRNR